MRKNHKAEYIAEHGQEQWDLYNEYKHRGNRSPEAIDARRVYDHYQQGLNGDTYTIYTIAEGSKIVYVGRTGMSLVSRWTKHKTAARTSSDTSPLHIAMMTTTDPATFPEWTCQAYITTTDKNASIELEKLAIVALRTNIEGYNRRIGGGNFNKNFGKHDAMIALVQQGYPL